MKGIVLCAVLLVFLARNQSYGASSYMEFIKDPNFPGNPLWMKNLQESLPMNKPGFPGSPEWNRKLEEKMSGPDFPGSPEWQKKLEESIGNSMTSANAQSATGYTGSNVVIAPVVQSLPDGTSKITTPTVVTSMIGGKISQPRFPKIKPIKPPKYVKPIAVKPRKPLLKPTPPLTTPVTTFAGDKERNIMTNMQNSNIGGNVVFNPIVQTMTDDGKLITTTPSMINGKPILLGAPTPSTTVVNGVQEEIIPSTTLTPTVLPEVSVTGATDVNGVQKGIMNDLKFENLGNNGNEHVVISPVVQSPGLKVNENGDVDFS
ncbi:uncharacterized protein LOC111050403 isoform X1 [Nilaparvata lugens]|uniref:uncharacterized protein LOC111050403 isoform X1 n=1 Tax=Nilaparvata lugens TaxID=108931 RepID=UPI00193D1333|nr:uncharacterized protein LOC111050403 isoform X1 [Nilaparvata lugens]